MYLDLYPSHYQVTMQPKPTAQSTTRSVETDRQEIPNPPKQALSRLKNFVSTNFRSDYNRNCLIIGGHGESNGQLFPIDETTDSIHFSELAAMLESVLGKEKPLALLALDACQLALENSVFALRNVTHYLIAYQV